MSKPTAAQVVACSIGDLLLLDPAIAQIPGG